MDIIEQLKRDEGVKLKPYRDSVGKLTIGVGRNLDDVGLHKGEEDILLNHDIALVQADLRQAFPWMETTLDEVRYWAVVNMTFNLGIGGISEFRTFLAQLSAGNWSSASGAMLDSLWARQVGPRATRLALQIQTGSWQ